MYKLESLCVYLVLCKSSPWIFSYSQFNRQSFHHSQQKLKPMFNYLPIIDTWLVKLLFHIQYPNFMDPYHSRTWESGTEFHGTETDLGETIFFSASGALVPI